MKDNQAREGSAQIQGMQPREAPNLKGRPINCDQVAWMLDAIDRHLPPSNKPAVSRAREMQKYALFYEIMEVAHLHFEDEAAQHNGTPPDVRRFRFASKLEQAYSEGALAKGLGDVAGPQGKRGYVTMEEAMGGIGTWDGDHP